MTMLINRKCLTKIEKLKSELKDLRKDLAKKDIKKDISLLKLSVQEAELIKRIEKEKLLRKYYEPQNIAEETTRRNKSIGPTGAQNIEKDISEVIQKQDQTGVSDKSLSELVNLIIPSEKDMKDALEEMGLKHLIKKKQGKS